MCHICTRLPTQLYFVGSNPGSPHHMGILASLASGVSERICIWCTVSPSAFVPVVSLGVHPSVPVLTSGLQITFEFLRGHCCQSHSITPFFNLLLCQISTLICYPRFTCGVRVGIATKASSSLLTRYGPNAEKLWWINCSKSCRYDVRAGYRLIMNNTIL